MLECDVPRLTQYTVKVSAAATFPQDPYLFSLPTFIHTSGRVEIGSFNQTDVAVKILTDLPADGHRPSLSGAPLDDDKLLALRKEVCSVLWCD